MKQKKKSNLAQFGSHLLIYPFLCICLMSSVLTVKTQTGSQAEIRPLPNQTMELTLKGGETHSYKINLRAGEYFHVEVDQRGIDVQLVLVGDDGKVIIERDRPNGTQGAESLSFIATMSRDYRLDVKALEAKAEAGKYEIKSDVPRAPTTTDNRRIEAETLFQEALQLSQQENAESVKQACEKYETSASLWREIGEKYAEALAQTNLGYCREGLREIEKAVAAHEKALALYRELKDRANEAMSLSSLCLLNALLQKPEIAIEQYGQAKAIFRELKDHNGEKVLNENFGKTAEDYLNAGYNLFQKQEAESYQNALKVIALARLMYVELEDKSNEALTLLALGRIKDDLGEKQKALDYYNQALPLYRAVGDKSGEAVILSNIGSAYSALGEKQKALDHFNQALPLCRVVGNRSSEAATLNNIGSIYSDLGEKQKALDYYNRALPLYRAVGDKRGEAAILTGIGSAYSALGEKQEALDYFNQALPLRRAVKDRRGEAATFNNIGSVYSDLGEKQKALDYYNQALLLHRAAGDRSSEATTLNNIGSIYSDLGEKQKALGYYNQALPLHRAVKDRRGEAIILSNIGSVYSALDEKQKALDYHNQALPLYRAVGDRSSEATALNSIGLVLSALGEKQKALDYYDQALPIRRAVGDKSGEATTLTGIGSAYSALGEKQKALDYFNQALPLRRAVKDRRGEATTLNNIGIVYSDLGEEQKALDYYNQALPLYRAVGDRSSEAAIFNNIGSAYSTLGEKQKALDYYNQALPLYRAVGDKSGEAATLNNTMFVWHLLKNPRLAVFYGKQSTNVYQQFRTNNQELDKEFQKTFLKSIEDTYRKLSELLIEQGRLAEAVQVLNSFKDQQYFDFNPDTIKKPVPLDLTQREAGLSSRYDATSAKVGEIGGQLEEIKRITASRTPGAEESARLQQLEADLKTATDEFLNTVKQAETEFSGPPDAVKDKSPDVKDASKMQTALLALNSQTNQKAVAVYTLVGENNFRALIITHKDIIPVTSLVTDKELNEKAKEFLTQLRETKERTNTPKFSEEQVQKTGKELYDIVFAPVAAKLKELNIRPDVLMWSLDGGLRYVPVAALYDGRQYLAERYRNVVFTRADAKRMLSLVRQTWTGSGFYTSKQYSVPINGEMKTFPGLKNAKAEVERIFGVPPTRGIVNGKFLPNQQFTKDSLLEILRLHRPLVHIASHFTLVPGDASSSFLLLGDGNRLTLANIKDEPDDFFGGVELLTLSACETGAQKERESDGREIDSFAELAQRKGAQAILASLWNVDDESTSRLMMEFYQKKQRDRLTKAEALQKAQLVIMKDSSYSHPFYWSPFILTGNWR
jgi:CHAT domain-containing protein/tetratricopeptide (TPR) repeat protein